MSWPAIGAIVGRTANAVRMAARSFGITSRSVSESAQKRDIDIAVVVDDAGDDFFAINPLLWKLRRSIDDRIEPVLIEKNRDRAGLLDTIKKTGI